MRGSPSFCLPFVVIGLCRWWRVDATYTLYGNARIFTAVLDPTVSDGITAEALAVDDETGDIVGVGTENNIRSSLGEESEFFDLQGQMILPGFQDAHLHAVEAGINALTCYFEGSIDMYDIPWYIQGCPDEGYFGGEGWIFANGLDISDLQFQVKELGYDWPIAVLDEDYPDTPVLILDNLGHGAVVNTKALQLVGYEGIQTNPLGGIIDLDVESGRPTGFVRENAQQMFRSAMFPPTPANRDIAYESLLGALGILNANGITTVSDAGGFWLQAQTESWERAEEDGLMTVRASNALYVYPDIPMEEQLPQLLTRFSNDPSKLVRFNQAKLYVDGILSLATSALKEPYETSLGLPFGEEYGFEYFGGNLQAVSRQLSEAGFQLHLHVTGDRGASIALDAIQVSDPNSGPHRLTHCYLVAEEDIGRFQEMNVVADFQLTPSSTNDEYEAFIADYIGPDRANKLLPATPILNTGGLVTLSSDWDADELSPLVKIKTVLTRPGNGKAIPSLAEALRMYTINPAILLNHSEKTGTLEIGKHADFVVLDADLFQVSVASFDTVNVVATFLQGEVVYDPAGIFGVSLGTKPPSSSAKEGRGIVSYSLLGLILLVNFSATIGFIPCIAVQICS